VVNFLASSGVLPLVDKRNVSPAPEVRPGTVRPTERCVSYDTEPDATPTTAQYAAFEAIVAFFNATLFDGKLPPVMLTFNRRNRTRGYFVSERWARRDDAEHLGEIALNPDHLRERTAKETASTIVHEMVHLWQHAFGEPSRTGYHNGEWADQMESVGLMPSDTGAPGGKRVGQRVTHYIIEGGRFDRAFDELPAEWFLPFTAVPLGGSRSKGSARSKTSFVCPDCGAKAWGKPDLRISCVDCESAMEAESIAR
jgi:predicted SprT family Zn-dependent metalloprotease